MLFQLMMATNLFYRTYRHRFITLPQQTVSPRIPLQLVQFPGGRFFRNHRDCNEKYRPIPVGKYLPVYGCVTACNQVLDGLNCADSEPN